MDLLNASGSYNPLTSLIQYEGAWTARAVVGVPYIDEAPEPRRGNRGVLSVILHELIHLASFRTTRLGWITHEFAARLLRQWTDGSLPAYAGRMADLVGTMTPVLEGLAMFAQLDLETDDSRLSLYSAPTFYARATSGHGVHTSQTLRAARLSQVQSAGENDRGLLHLLFEDSTASVSIRNIYRVGYLWTKAVAASLARRSPHLQPADVMLPLLIRILCDHPALLRVYRDELAVEEVLPAIQRSIVSWSSASLHRLAVLLEDESVRDRIDHLHVVEFLDSGGTVVSYADETAEAFVGGITDLDADSWHKYHLIRAAASIHFTSRSRGTVSSVNEDKHEIVLNVGDVEVTIRTSPVMNIWNMAARFGADTERLERTYPTALGREQSVFRLAAEAKGAVTIAKYFGLSSPHDSGLAIWDDERELLAYLSFVPEALDNEQHNEMLRLALSFSLEKRSKFAGAIVVGEDFRASADAAVNALLEGLISSPKIRSNVIQSGFASALPTQVRAELSKWTAVDVLRVPHLPSGELLRGVASVLDLVGFAGTSDGEQVVPSDLFPTIR